MPWSPFRGTNEIPPMKHSPVVINCIQRPRGLFSYLTCLLALLEKYGEKGVPVYADWSGARNYHEAARETNVFEYFFDQPMILGISPQDVVIEETEGSELLPNFFNQRIYSFDPDVRLKASRLLAKYIRVRPGIVKKAEDFRARSLGNLVLGIHVRSTDQYSGGHLCGQKLPFDVYLDQIDRAVFAGGYKQIFIASDDETVIELLRDNYRHLVTYDCVRSRNGQALHLNPSTEGYQIGEEVLIESLILSQCQFFIASPSNVSSMVTFWNPNLSFISALHGIVHMPPTF